MDAPNLFSYATKELSQDAVICWLVKWAAHDGASELTQLGRCFVESLLNHKRQGPNVNLKGGVSKVEIYPQEKHIDVLARVNEKHVLLIEDKTDSEPHGDQLATYRNAVLSGETKLRGVSEEDLFAIYFKTGNHSSATERNIENSGYSVFNRTDFLAVLNNYRGDNAILLDFKKHLASIESQTQSFLNWRSDGEDDRTWYAWEGLYGELERRLFVADSDHPWRRRGWGYVPNPSGGFLGFWWLPAELPDEHCAYLQLEQEKLCFKVLAGDDSSAEKQDELKWVWNERLTRQHGRVVKPKVMRRGSTMTVAVHEGRWLRYDDYGVLDLHGTVESLREAERVLLAASRTS